MPKVLIVDDDWAISEQLKIYLEDLGYDVVGVADSGKTAIEMAVKLQPDLIIMDIVLGGEMDGIEVARKVRASADTAVMFITGYEEEEFIKRAKELDPFGYILKPYNLWEIRASVEIALHKRETERKLSEMREQLEQKVKDQTVELRTANDCLNALMNATRDVALLIDREGVVLTVNERTALRYHLSSGELIGKNIYDLLPPDLVESRKSLLERVVKLKKPLRFEDKRRQSVFEAAIYPVMNNDGEVVQFAVFGRDVTALKRTLDELKKREDELKAKTVSLQEANTALSVLLRRREDDRIDVEESFAANMNTWVKPYLKRLRETVLSEEQRIYLNALETSLERITAPLARDLSSAMINLTPMEIRVAGLVKEGRTTKQIAETLSVSVNTVLTHRFKLRTKLGIRGKKVDLKTHLLTFQ